MSNNTSVVVALSAVDWNAITTLVLNTEYSKALNTLASVWESAWRVYKEGHGHLSSNDRDALAMLVTLKAFMSFKCELYEASLEELNLVAQLYQWPSLDILWEALGHTCVRESSVRDLLASFTSEQRYPDLWSTPFPILWLLLSLAAELGDPSKVINNWISLLHFFSVVSKPTLLRRLKQGTDTMQTWTEDNVACAVECSLLRSIDLMLNKHMPLTASALLEGVAINDCGILRQPLARPHLDVMRVLLSLEGSAHERAVSLLHKVESQAGDIVCGQVAKAHVCQSVGRGGDAGTLFKQVHSVLKAAPETSEAAVVEFTKHCLKNNEAVASINEGNFLSAFIALYESLSTFLPLGVTGGSRNSCPGLVRVPMASRVGQAVALPVLFRNTKTLTEFMPLAQSRHAIVRELAVARHIEDRAVLRDVLGVTEVGGK
eukprot:Blabericola_migrator_1__5159@NODE_2660_length_2487_cov_42_538017_g1666_i0_p1_GENE_NODE_2660_length_2487_cov_42_538017_g1666_i0NODE_2660_length_2487_cov_42_538017_g1666_i0_p1_ORF_typecomplete_len432_score58_93_NODE_2660_length_2487_cov_42_538017_g1666_i07112006